jgi:hypothetical protein
MFSSGIADCICIGIIPNATLLGIFKSGWPAIEAFVFPMLIFTRFNHGRLPPIRAVQVQTLRETLG